MFTHYHVLTFFNINPITVNPPLYPLEDCRKIKKKELHP